MPSGLPTVFIRIDLKLRMIRVTSLPIFVFNGGLGPDFDGEFIFPILQFKIDRMADYWRHFSHCMNGDYVLSQLELANRLLQNNILCWRD